MSNLNLVVLEGIVHDKLSMNDTRDVCNFKVKDSQRGDIFNIKTSLRLAEVCFKYLEKGSHVLISGCLSKDGIEGREVKFLPKKSA